MMTESVLTTATPVTTLAGYIIESGHGPNLSPLPKMVPYLGALTPQYFAHEKLDAPELETGALLTAAAVHDLGWLRRVAVRGEDRFRWLSGMVTNAVETLKDKSGAYNLVLNAQGRIQGDCYVWRDGDEVELGVTAEQSEALLAHLDRFIIMDDVELVPLPDQSALGLTGPLADRILAKLGLTSLPEPLSSGAGAIGKTPVHLYRGHGTLNPEVPHYELWVASEQIPALWESLISADASPVGAAALETLRILEGIPAYGIDIESRYLAQETSQNRALNFVKGCYLGQEIVERIRSRGQVHRHLRAIELTPSNPTGRSASEIPTAGTELRLAGSPVDSKPAGTLTSVTSLQLDGARRVFAIAMVRAEVEVGNQLLTYSLPDSSGTAQILNSTPKFTTAEKAAEENA